MSLLTTQMTPKMSTAYSGLSALIQAATSQLGDLAEAAEATSTNSPEGSPPFLSNPTTPTLEGSQLYLDGTSSSLSSWHGNGAGATVAATVTPVLSSVVEGSAKLLFPEVLMHLLSNPANEDIVTFLPDGKYFAIRRLEFTKELLCQNFQTSIFEDFLKEARGWGFIRVNGSNTDVTNCSTTSTSTSSCTTSNTNNGDCNESTNGCGSEISKDEIFVFRHTHFEQNQPVNIGKMRRQAAMRISQEHNAHTTTTTTTTETNNSSSSSSKRQLPPSTDSEDFDDYRQRLRIDSRRLPVDGDSFLLPGSAACDQPLQLRRRSSLELRGVAEAITASKLQLNSSSMEIVKDESPTQDSPILSDTDLMPPKLERRQSTASSLVDGGVETATQNIVTDAIEALLFDENHTRETYNRHEKELSISSLPGVVPISKQLFSANDSSDMADDAKNNKNDETSKSKSNKSSGRKEKETTKTKSELSSSSSSWDIPNTSGSLEDASRNNGDNLSSSNRNLQVIIPSDGVGEPQNRSMVVSPARMEAAAALVSQARVRINGR